MGPMGRQHRKSIVNQSSPLSPRRVVVVVMVVVVVLHQGHLGEAGRSSCVGELWAVQGEERERGLACYTRFILSCNFKVHNSVHKFFYFRFLITVTEICKIWN